jgi:uncharacterized protein (DUF2344 family)
MNKQLPKGLYIHDAKIKESKDNIMASISGAAYELLISAKAGIEFKELQNQILEFLAKQEIIVKKENKKGTRDMDIKPMIVKLKVKKIMEENNNSDVDIFLQNYIKAQRDPLILPPSYNLENIFSFSAMLCAGSVANLKPELLFGAISEFVGDSIKLVKIHRSGLFVNIGGAFNNPLDTAAL